MLELGKGIISFRVRESLEGQVTKYTYTGWDMLKAEGVTGSAEAGEVTVKAGGERFSGEYVAERVEHELGADGFITEVHLRRNIMPGGPRGTSAVDEERERQRSGGGLPAGGRGGFCARNRQPKHRRRNFR